MTSHSRNSSIAARLMLGTVLIALAAFGATAAISYWKSSRALLATSQAELENLAELEAQRISAELAGSYDTARTLANTLLLQRRQGTLTRPAAAALFRSQLESHPEWVGMGTMWEPDAFDGKDAEHVGDEAHDDTGRFMSYWAWDNGTLVTEPLRDYEVPGAGDWYLQPRERKAPMLVEPYEYQIGGNTVLMTTLSMPLLQDGNFLGMVTVDFALSTLQQRLSKLTPMGAGHVVLLSPAGRVLASKDAAEVGKLREDPTTRRALEKVARGEIYSDFAADADGNVEVYAPMRVGATEQRFAIGVIVPRTLLMRQARSLLWIVAGVGVASAAALCLALFLLLRGQVVRPLSAAMAVADDIASGKLDTPIRITRRDEIGSLLESMRRMQQQLQAVMAAQRDMARRHDEGEVGYRMDETRFPGEYGGMVRDTNALVGAHVQLMLRLVEVMGSYARGDLSVDMDRLPGEKAAITEAMDETRPACRRSTPRSSAWPAPRPPAISACVAMRTASSTTSTRWSPASTS